MKVKGFTNDIRVDVFFVINYWENKQLVCKIKMQTALIFQTIGLYQRIFKFLLSIDVFIEFDFEYVLLMKWCIFAHELLNRLISNVSILYYEKNF